MNNILINPLRQEVIRVDPLCSSDVVLDKLNKDLSFKREIAKCKNTNDLQKGLNHFCSIGKAKDSGWIKVEVQYSMPQMFKSAMKQLQSKTRKVG